MIPRLAVVLDLDVHSWAQLQSSSTDASELPCLLERVCKSIVAFVGAFITQNRESSVQIHAASVDRCDVVFSPTENWDVSAVCSRLRTLCLKNLDSAASHQGQTSLLCGSLSRALCCICKKEQSLSTVADLTDTGGVVAGDSWDRRVFIVRPSCVRKGVNTLGGDYMSLMNLFFTAQKHSVLIDCLPIGPSRATLFEQACDLTGGTCHRADVASVVDKSLLALLNVLFLPSGNLRSAIARPSCGNIDYRPACFCHQKLIDVGFVCSVCLSVYCSFRPFCLTCSSVFKLPVVPKKIKRKK